KRTGNAGGTGAAIRLDHVTINLNGTLTYFFQIKHGAQRSSDQPLDFHSTSGLLAFGCLALHSLTRGTWQHAIFRCQPTLPRPFEKRGDFLDDTGSTNNFGFTIFNQY